MKEIPCKIIRDSKHVVGFWRWLNQGDFYATISHNPRNPRGNNRERRSCVWFLKSVHPLAIIFYYFPVNIVGILIIMITDKFYFRASFTRESITLSLPEGNVKSEGVSVIS
jgi:hypothetical protein